MDGFLEHQLICRACLRIVENKTQSFGYIEDVNGNLKDMIMCCVPEMDIYVSSHPIMCFPCIQLLITVYNFKTRCLNTETIIRSYIQRNNLIEYNHVNLSCVVQELIRLNSYFRDMHNRNRLENERTNNVPMENQCGTPRNPYGMPVHHSGMPYPGGIPGNQSGLPGNRSGAPGNQSGVPGSLSGLPLNEGGLPRNESGMPGNESGTLGNQIIAPGSQTGAQGDQSGPPENTNSAPGNHNGTPINQSGAPINQSGAPGNQSGVFKNPRGVSENQRGALGNQMGGRPGIQSGIPGNLRNIPGNPYGPLGSGFPGVHSCVPGGIPGNPCDILVNHCGIPASQAGERNDYLPLTREEISAAPATSENSDSTGEVSYTVRPVENNTPVANEKTEVPPIENRMRLVIKIDKGKVTLPYGPCDRNEDSNEKENEQQDVEMKEKETPLPPENGLMYPPPQNNRQELYECVNCTFVTTHLNFLLAHNTVCISDHEKIDLKKCPHCPHVTNRQYALNKHINTMHTKAIWYSCDLCNYRSTDSSCLRRHKRNVHPEVTGNELCCHLCAYRCMTEYHLKKHLLKHDENTILQCQFCSYSTKDRSNFRKHIFIHNPKAQDCEFCDYKCVSPYQMKVHLKKYHHGVGMEDIDCRSEVSISEVVDDITAAINETQTYIGHQAE